jgi:hypothetical protein
MYYIPTILYYKTEQERATETFENASGPWRGTGRTAE